VLVADALAEALERHRRLVALDPAGGGGAERELVEHHPVPVSSSTFQTFSKNARRYSTPEVIWAITRSSGVLMPPLLAGRSSTSRTHSASPLSPAPGRSLCGAHGSAGQHLLQRAGLAVAGEHVVDVALEQVPGDGEHLAAVEVS
jgi:hypothetical protein